MEIFSGYGRRGVVLHEYNNAPATDQKDTNECIGYVEPVGKCPAWILYFTNKGDAIFYAKRGPNGAVKGTPVRVKAHNLNLCEAFRANNGTSWALFMMNSMKGKYHQCNQPAIRRVNNEYVESGGEKKIWLCDECDKLSASK